MQFKKFTLTEFSFKNSEHYKLIKQLEKAEGINYISRDLSNFVKESKHSEKIIPGNTYVIENNDKDLVGLLGFMDLDRCGNLEIWTIINPYYRGKHYASMTLGTIVPYMIENVDGLNDIKLVIQKNNENSKRVAISNGFNEVERIDDKDVYYYFKSK